MSGRDIQRDLALCKAGPELSRLDQGHGRAVCNSKGRKKGNGKGVVTTIATLRSTMQT